MIEVSVWQHRLLEWLFAFLVALIAAKEYFEGRPQNVSGIIIAGSIALYFLVKVIFVTSKKPPADS